MDAPMKRPILLGAAMVIAASNASAHRLDEYLQATRIAVATNRIDVTVDLTPGVAIVDQLLAGIDANRDDRVTTDEATAYVRRLVGDLALSLDGRPLVPGPGDIRFPPVKDARAGVGVIRLRLSVRLTELSAGEHEFKLVNQHLPAVSVHLVNALVPADAAIQIVRQERNENQSEYRLVFRCSRPRRSTGATRLEAQN
jgi:hypothetical protein